MNVLRKRSIWVLLAVILTVLACGVVWAQAYQGITPTNEWVNFYSQHTTVDGNPVPPGSVVRALAPSGTVCGEFVVHTAGSYGLLPCYRDDPETADIEGANPGDVISFTINGVPATVLGPDQSIWTHNLDLKQVDLKLEGGPPPFEIPEPTSLLLFGAGLVCFGFYATYRPRGRARANKRDF